MKYCTRCCYPANARPGISFDEKGVCSGCRVIESRSKINWEEREGWLRLILEKYRAMAKKNGSIYDCIIPVSGGKDSHYQTYLIKEIYKMNPLLVTFNHAFNSKLGIRNLTNLVRRFKCDLIRFTINPESVRKISLYMLKKVGDITWHYHAGIMTFPIQVAVKYKIPLMIWGEEGFSQLVGMFNQDDMVEFTKKKRQEHSMRGFEPEDLINDPDSGLTERDLFPYFYPSDEEIEEVGVRGIYLGNYMYWNAKKQTELMIEKCGFQTHSGPRDRTFNLYDKIDDLANGAHDYLKYLKFGYGRATDDASTEIRYGRMTREEGIEMVKRYDHIRPRDLDLFLRFVGMTEEKFINSVEHLRDKEIWEKDKNGKWIVRDSIANHVNDPGIDEVRLPLSKDKKAFIKRLVSTSPRDSRLTEDEFIIL